MFVWWQYIFLILSNLFFILPAILALKLDKRPYSFIWSSIVPFSGLFHACKGDWINEASEKGFCWIFSFHELRNFDYLFAQMTLVLVGLYFINFNALYDKNKKKIRKNMRWIEDFLIYSYIVITVILLRSVEQGVFTFILLTCSVLIIVLAFWTWDYYFYGNLNFPVFNTRMIICSAVFSSLSLFLFIGLSNESYWFAHSIWHIFGSLSVYFLLQTRTRKYLLQSKSLKYKNKKQRPISCYYHCCTPNINGVGDIDDIIIVARENWIIEEKTLYDLFPCMSKQ